MTLTIAKQGVGDVNPDVGGHTYIRDHVATANATPANGFDHWEGDLEEDDNPANPMQVVKLTQSKSLTAVFKPMYTLTMAREGDGGTVSPGVGPHDYRSGESASLSAYGNDEWLFTGWSGDVSGTLPLQNITMDGNKSATAHFVQAIKITVNKVGQGSVSPGTGVYPKGGTRTFTATPATGWRWDHWEGVPSGQEGDPSLDLPMDQSRTITAHFIERAKLTVVKELIGNLPADGGTVSPGEGVHEYDKGEVVSLSAAPASGWRFKQWSGGASGTNPSTTVTMSGDKTVTATFIQRHTVTTTSITRGVITPESGTWDHGQSASFVWEKESNFCFCQFSHWEGLPSSFSTTEWGPGTSDQKTVNVTINDSYHLDAYDENTFVTLTTHVDADGCNDCAVDPASQAFYLRDTPATVTATPGAGWGFVRWEGDVPAGMEEDNPLVMTMDENKDVTAVFGQVTLTASVDAGGCANCQTDPEDTYSCEDCTVEPALADYALSDPPVSGTVTAIPGAGWAFAGWEGSVPPELAQNNPLTIPMDADKHVTAKFETARLKITIDGEGTTDPAEGVYNYKPNDPATITATATACWNVRYWTGDVPEDMEDDNPLRLPMTRNRSITAHFAPPDATINSMTFSGDVHLHWDDSNWEDDKFESDGLPILASTPHWAESGLTKPLCVIKDQSPGISVVIELPTDTSLAGKLKCAWTVDSATLTYVADVALTGGIQTVELTTTDKVPNKIFNGDSQAEWSVSCDGGATWDDIGSGSIKTFVIYGTPNANEDLEDPALVAIHIDFTFGTVATAHRIDFLTSSASGKSLPVDVAEGVANGIAGICNPGDVSSGWPIWKLLDERKFECYSGKILGATGVTMLGIPRSDVRTKLSEGCAAYPSTDVASPPSGYTYKSDCTQLEGPDDWCSDEGNCSTYGNLYSHPAHDGYAGIPMVQAIAANPDAFRWPLCYAGGQVENFFKVKSSGGWYYLTVFPAKLWGQGSDTPGDDADKEMRYKIYSDSSISTGKQFFQLGETNKIPAADLPK